MIIKFNKHALKFLEKIDDNLKERIRLKIKKLATSIETEGFIPYKELDIKKLEGEWSDYMRLVVGKTRIIFKFERKEQTLYICEIDFRGNVYN